MLSKTHKLTIREQYSSEAPDNRGISRRLARHLMLSISLVAFSPEALLTSSEGQINWIERACAGNDNDAFMDLAPLKDETLEKQRGGFSVAGLEIDVGVSISTTIDGFLEVATNYSLDSGTGLVHLGSEIKNLAQNMTDSMIKDIQSKANAAVSDIQEEANSTTTAAMETNPATLSISEGASYDNDISVTVPEENTANTSLLSTASTSSPLTNKETPAPKITASTIPQPQTTSVTAPEENTNNANIASATATPSPANSETPTPENFTEIVHQTNEGHVTLLTNRLNNASIRQTVTLNISLENFSKIQDIARLQKDLTQITHQISLFSLRH